MESSTNVNMENEHTFTVRSREGVNNVRFSAFLSSFRFCTEYNKVIYMKFYALLIYRLILDYAVIAKLM